MRQKKAAIELSVTAIIVLILAIVMLGLGLGFIRGMFGKVSSQIEQQIATEAEPPVPTSSNTITLSREVIITNAGNKEILKVSTYNPTNETWTDTSPSLTCTPPLDGIGVSANSKDIEQGEFVTFNVLLDIPSVAPDTHLCQVKMEDIYEKDLAIKITE